MAKIGLSYDYDQQLKENTFEPVPAGKYTIVLSEHAFKKNDNKDKHDGINWTFKVVGGEFDGRTITKFHYTGLGPDSVYFLDQVLKAFKIPMDGNNFDPMDGYGQQCEAMVKIEPSNKEGDNRMFNKIDTFLS